MQRMCKVCGDWHDLEQPWPVKCERHFTKSAAPNVISDQMDALKHHGSGEIIDSKRKFSATTRRLGLAEIGNEVPRPRKPIPLDKGQRREDIKRTLYEARNAPRH